jgi:hypothetical protein
MFILDDSRLQVGDIILERDDSIESALIRRQSGSQYSHALLCVDGVSLIDSNIEGVQSHNPRRRLYKNADDVLVLRSKNATKDQLLKVEQFARSKVGTAYSLAEARKSQRRELSDADFNRQFCTRFVAQSYEYGSISFVNTPDFCTPADIEKSPFLQIVNDVARNASEKEIAYAREGSIGLQNQIQITNDLLSAIRSLTQEDIQTFEQVNDYAEAHPEMTAEIIQLFKDSGYLEIWKYDIQKNPWHYSFEAFSEHYPVEQWKSLIEEIEKQEEALFRRFKPMHDHFQEQFKITGNAYYKLMADLYVKLLELNLKRLTVAIDARISIGYPPASK